jgi:hypothetical protein
VIILAALCFGFAILMHAFGWSSGKIDVTLFALFGLLFLALAGWRGPVWPFRRETPP